MSDTTTGAQGRTETAATDVAGRVEVRGIDFVPPEERHGGPRDVAWIYFSANMLYLFFVLGGTMILLGLSLAQAIGVVITANLVYVLVGWLATSGFASGTPSAVVTRAVFGVRANRVCMSGVMWVIAVVYGAINLALGALAGFALAAELGVPINVPVKVVILLALAVATFTVCIYGHATMVRLSPAFGVVMSVVLVLLGVFVVREADFGYTPAAPLSGAPLLAALCIGFTLIAAPAMSYVNGADFARYLPATSSRGRVTGWTALGGMLPSVVISVLGVLAGTRIDMTDPQVSIAEIVPSWFYPLFLFVVVAGSVSNNVLLAYSAGLYQQAMGIKLSRVRSVLLIGVLITALAAYASFATDFLVAVSNFLQFSITVLAPLMAVYATDIAVRRNRYDGLALHDETPGGPFWYRNGINWAGVSALLLGAVAALMCVNTTLWTAPVATALDGADLSLLAGPVVAAVTYLLLRPAASPAGAATTPLHAPSDGAAPTRQVPAEDVAGR
jgi:NCS1 family nucleobase:cation symporter-1